MLQSMGGALVVSGLDGSAMLDSAGGPLQVASLSQHLVA